MSGWTDERVALLIKLRTVDGLSCGQIAKKLGGVTREAVIGKLSRLKISLPGRPTMRLPRRDIGILRGPKVIRNLKADTAVASGALRNITTTKPLPKSTVIALTCEPVDFEHLSRTGCKWPVGGDGADTLYCGDVRDGRRPFCVEHSKLGFQKAAQSKADLIRNCRRAAG